MVAIKKILTVSLFLIVQLTFGQNKIITGSLYGKDGNDLIGAVVTLTSSSDSTDIISYTVTDVEGEFRLTYNTRVPVVLEISFMGYKTYKKELPSSKNYQLGKINMIASTIELNEVLIESSTPAIIKGDTVQHNAKSYKINPDANAADLLLKMSGVVEDNGSVKAQGEDVQKVLVNGKEFFNNDPNVALKNLPADIISKIEIFDQLSEQAQLTGFDDGESIKTINIITTEEAKNGKFGRLYGGYGNNDSYSVGGNLNSFEDNKRITVLGLVNNINMQNFSAEDLNGILNSNNSRGKGGGRGRIGGNTDDSQRFSAGGSVNDFLIGNQSGISEIGSFGLNYNNSWSEKWETNASYFFNRSINNNDTFLSQEFLLLNELSQHYLENSLIETYNINHRVNARVKYNIDNNNTLTLIPSLSVQNTEVNSLITADNLSQEELIGQSDNIEFTDNTSYMLSNQLMWQHKFKKRGRSLSTKFKSTWSNSDGLNELNAITNYLSTPSDTTSQASVSSEINNSLTIGLHYTEPLSRTGQLILSYNLSKNEEEIDNLTTSQDGNIMLLDTALSAVLNSDYLTQSAGIGYQLRLGRGAMLMTKANYEYADLQNRLILPYNEHLNIKFNNILPIVVLRYKFSDANLMLFYRTRTNKPNAAQLQESIDNTNPLQLTTGNPNLEQSYTHTFVSKYSKTNLDNSTNWFWMMYFNYTNDYISNSSFVATEDTMLEDGTYLTRGTQLSSPVNLNNYWNIRSFFNYSLPINLIQSKLNLNTGINYTQVPGLVNNVLNKVRTYDISQSMVLASNISPKVDFALTYGINYNIVKNDIQQDLDQNYLIQNAAIKLNWIFGNDFVFRHETSLQRYEGFGDELDQDVVLWNMSFGKKMLKNKQAELAIKIYDVLNQNNNLVRNVTESYIESVESLALQQYLMLSFAYKLRNFKS